MVSMIRTIVYTIGFYIGSIPLVMAAALTSPLGRPALFYFPRAWARYHALCRRWLLGQPLKIIGTLPTGAVIIAIKHESFCETFETLRLFEKPAVVFKAELLRIPIWGPAARAHGVIPVEREAGASAMRAMLKAAREAIADGRPIIIFPEGTRVRHGERPALRPGIAGLYKTLNLPIVPIAVDTGLLWTYKGFLKRPGTVTFKVGETIPAGLPREVVETRVHTAINALNMPAW
jgi:1-acyl-sn-glycerol-3-phosphate acyltransferase